MDIKSLITPEELDMMEYYRDAYVFHEGSYQHDEYRQPMEKILQVWLENKEKRLLDLIGNSLMITKEISYEKSYEELSEEVDEMTYQHYGRNQRSGHDFITAFESYLDDINNFGPRWSWNPDYNREKDELRNKLYRLISTDTLVKNRYSGESFCINDENGKPFKISYGCKASKVLGKLANIFHIDGFEDFRICHSQILNQKILKGRLTLSIHPLDYMTMSDNECGWESCMNWRDNGCYRQGTVEMMNSPTVVVAYLSSDSDVLKIGDKVWNSKKWRQLFVVDKNVLIGVKDYPYHNEDLTAEVLNWLKELVNEKFGWTYESEIQKYDADEPVVSTHISDKPGETVSFHFDFPTSQMYSDFGALDYHLMYLSNNISSSSIQKYKGLVVPYSGPSQCMNCGEITSDFEDESCLACANCQEEIRCDCCDEIITDGEIYYVDDVPLCSYCFDNETAPCYMTDENHLLSNMYKISVIPRLSAEVEKKARNYLAKNTFYYNSDSDVILPSYEGNVHIFASEAVLRAFKEQYMKENGCIYRSNTWSDLYIYFDDINDDLRNDILSEFKDNNAYLATCDEVFNPREVELSLIENI